MVFTLRPISSNSFPSIPSTVSSPRAVFFSPKKGDVWKGIKSGHLSDWKKKSEFWIPVFCYKFAPGISATFESSASRSPHQALGSFCLERRSYKNPKKDAKIHLPQVSVGEDYQKKQTNKKESNHLDQGMLIKNTRGLDSPVFSALTAHTRKFVSPWPQVVFWYSHPIPLGIIDETWTNQKVQKVRSNQVWGSVCFDALNKLLRT